MSATGQKFMYNIGEEFILNSGGTSDDQLYCLNSKHGKLFHQKEEEKSYLNVSKKLCC